MYRDRSPLCRTMPASQPLGDWKACILYHFPNSLSPGLLCDSPQPTSVNQLHGILTPHLDHIFLPDCVFSLFNPLPLDWDFWDSCPNLKILLSLSVLLQWETCAGSAHVCQPLLATIFDFPSFTPWHLSTERKQVSQQREQWPRPATRSSPTGHFCFGTEEGEAWFRNREDLPAWGLLQGCQENICQPEGFTV